METALTTPLALALLPELNHELALTRRVLERLPAEHFGWQPHPRSMTLGHLASHTADLLGGIKTTFETTELDLANSADHAPAPATAAEELVQRLEANGAAARETLSQADAEDFEATWTLRFGEQIILRESRADIVRHLINHTIHHRGQLSVYLRLLEVPVPYIYGPSADEATA
ncbi:DinB family protein [Hymenobacter taeanensis]|uniref:DinB family protein n=1 Tax=Hymenobacter taeanensis TaxID=2735321 RepID=A0A6M6BD41_9BACT|nr:MULTISPECIES: DinB family protein [Hymenobacter]QJX46411.1 DinB family protein [Hymenobacter taeanensis]UOQ80272.1 DinB family protein [Hymenobacter sp. 5414T-23]